MRDRFQTIRFVGVVAAAKSRRVRLSDNTFTQLDLLSLGAYYYFDSHGNPLDWPAWTLLVAHNANFLKLPGSVSIGDYLKVTGKLQAINLETRRQDEHTVAHILSAQRQQIASRFAHWLHHLPRTAPLLKATRQYLEAALLAYTAKQLSLGTLITRTRQALLPQAHWLLDDFQGLQNDLRPLIATTQAQIDQLMTPAFLITHGRRLEVSRAYHPAMVDWHPRANDPTRAQDDAYRHEQFQQIVANQAFRALHQVPLVPQSYFKGKRFWDPQNLERYS